MSEKGTSEQGYEDGAQLTREKMYACMYYNERSKSGKSKTNENQIEFSLSVISFIYFGGHFRLA